jgi:hypothetical protein
VDPARFLAERRRVLAAHAGFNTVSPYRTVCTLIRKELLAAASPGSVPTSTTGPGTP